MTPHAPWTMNCIRKAPIASRTGLPEKAQSGTIGNDRSAAATIARRRPIRSDRGKSAADQDPARDWSYHIDSKTIISVLVGSLSAPIGTLLFSGLLDFESRW